MAQTINIKCTNGDKFAISADLTETTVAEFKTLVETQSNIPGAQQRLIYKGHVLQDPKTLKSYSIEDGHTIILVRGARPRADQPAAAAAAPAPAPAPAPAAGFAPAPGLFPGGGANANPFASMMGIGGGQGGMPDMARMQQELLSNPEQMQAMMNSPMMQSLMDNPELIQSIFQNNPQFRDIVDRNPELAHVLNDPAIIRQSMQMASNPNLMREMMRNTDRAMSNIEAHPEGFNALRRMYENVQEPMMEAAVDANRPPPPVSNTQSQGPSPASPSGAPLPNPWAAPAPSASPAPANANAMFGMPMMPPAAGAGFPFGGVSPEQMSQMMQNPFVQQMMQQMMSDPVQMQAMLNSNPQTRAMLESNPQMMAAMQNPAVLQAMANPQMLQAVMQMMNPQARQPAPAANGAAAAPNSAAPAQAQANPFGNLAALQQMMAAQGGSPFGQQFGAYPFGQAASAPPSNVQPEILYRDQLSQLNEMGFTDAGANLTALLATGGNVQAAIERLLQ